MPATQREVALIEKLYHQDFGTAGIQTLEEDQATKAAFLAQAGRYRYLAPRHAWLLHRREAPAAATQVQRGATPFGGPQSAELHAGLLSGLALSGANQTGRATGSDTSAASSGDNGILTAEEIGAQNLDGVQLVMLSACETGLGKAAGGEGLLGLQRSFQAAGARAVVASLWKVPDEETKALMGGLLYESLAAEVVAAGVAAAGAVGHAAELRPPGRPLADARLFADRGACPRAVLRRSPPAGRRTRLSPAYWAAFVLSGDWR